METVVKRSSAILAFCVVFIAVEMLGLSAGEKQENCNYIIIIETTCSTGTGTSDHISLRFGDSKSNDVLVHQLNSKHVWRVDRKDRSLPTVLDDVARKPFQVCTTDEFQVTGNCVESAICYLYLKHSGQDVWRPGKARVIVSGTSKLNSNNFYFRRFLPQHVWHGSDTCDTVVTPFGIRRGRKVFATKSNPNLPY